MNRLRLFTVAAITSLSLLGASAYAAEDNTKPGAHTHHSEMNPNAPDKEVAAQYKDEAAMLLKKAESHRKLAQLYRNRTPPKGGGSYANVAKHCEKLADLYAQAAKEAGAIADELD